MFTSRLRVALSILMLTTGLAACDQNSPQPAQSGSSLMNALTFAPADTSVFSFTDWTLLKKYMKLENLPEKVTREQVTDLIQKLRSQAPSAMLEQTSFAIEDNPFLQTWSWNFADVDWETNLESSANEPPVEVIKLRDNFDMAPAVARFQEHGFTESDYAGAKLYTHDLTIKEEWERTGWGIRMHNVAVLADKKMLVLSSGADSVKAVVDAVQKGESGLLAGDKAITDMVTQLGEVGAVEIMAGKAACDHFSFMREGNQNPTVQPIITKLREQIANGHAYDAFAAGYRYEGDQSLTFVAMHFDSPDSAKADMPIRLDMLKNGTSLQLGTGTTYDKMLTDRKATYDTEVAGSTLLIKFKGGSVTSDIDQVSSDLTPKLIQDMFFRADMTFAICPKK